MAADNFKVEVHSDSKEDFVMAVKMAWKNCSGKAVHYISSLPEGKCLECLKGTRLFFSFESADIDKSAVKYPCPDCNGTGKLPPKSAMILLWHPDYIRGVVPSLPLPFPLDCEAATEFLWSWLQTADFGKEPDQDGTNKRGFIVSTGDFWGHVEESSYAFLGVYPDWQMYGK